MTGLVDVDHRGVRLARWVPTQPGASLGTPAGENLGDFVGQAIATAIVSEGTGWGTRLLTTGSILHLAEPGDVVWGAGLNAKMPRPIPAVASELDYRAVRGPLTRLALGLAGCAVPEVSGDPASLLPDLFPQLREWATEKRRGTTVVPNLNDLPAFERRSDVVSPLGDPWSIMRAIAESEFVVGSSLHAVVIAEALGIPARFMTSSRENPWKYHDYLLATGRSHERFAGTVAEAEQLGGHEPVSGALDHLRGAFPIDLWETGSDHPSVVHSHTDDLLTDVGALITAEFDDVREPARGGLPMVRSIVRLLGAPAMQTYGHRVTPSRLADLTAALSAMIGDDLADLGLGSGTPAEYAALLAEGEHRRIHRIALRDAVRPRTRIESVEEAEGEFRWRFSGIGLGATPLRSAAGARAVLVHDSGELPLPPDDLEITVDYPDFRWTLDLDVTDIPVKADRFHLRIDWHDGVAWVPGPRVGRVPHLRVPHLGRGGGDWWRLSPEAMSVRIHDGPRSPELAAGATKISRSPRSSWLVGPPTPELSVVVTAHDVANWVDETLFGILRQDVEGMEVIVVDDHSADSTPDEIGRHRTDPRLYVIEPLDCGGANARDVGAAVARGRFLMFADGDDLVPDGAYGALVSSLESSGSDMAVGDYLKFSPSDIWRPTQNWQVFGERRTGVDLGDAPALIRGRAVWNKAFRRDFWEGNELTFPEVPRSNDIVPMTRAYLRAKSIDIVDRDVYLYRERPGGTSMTSRSGLNVGLSSYLRQELECMRLVCDDARTPVVKTLASLFIGADGWAHLRRAVLGGEEFDESISELVNDILAELPANELVARRDHQQVAMRLIAARRSASARAIIAFSEGRLDADPAGRLLDGWLDAIEFLPRIAPEDFHERSFERQVWQGIRSIARDHPDLPMCARWQRAWRLAPDGRLGPLQSAVLEYASRSYGNEEIGIATRLLADRPLSEPSSPTIDDWLALLSLTDTWSTEQVRLIWSQKISPIIETLDASGAGIPRIQWDRLRAEWQRSLAAHPGRPVARAAPLVAAYTVRGAEGVAARRAAASCEGITVDLVDSKRRRLLLGGRLPPGIPADVVAVQIRRQDGRHVRRVPVRSSGSPTGSRWAASIDAASLPTGTACSASLESFSGTDAVHHMPMLLVADGVAGEQAGIEVRPVDDVRSDRGIQLELVRNSEVRQRLHRAAGLLRRAKRKIRMMTRRG